MLALLIAFFSITAFFNVADSGSDPAVKAADKNPAIRTGAEQTAKYLPLIKGKRVGILANPTTIIGNRHLVDSLLSM